MELLWSSSFLLAHGCDVEMFQYCQGDYYIDSSNNAVPIRWLAPEVVEPSDGSVILRHITKDCNLWFVFYLCHTWLYWYVWLYLYSFVCDFIAVSFSPKITFCRNMLLLPQSIDTVGWATGKSLDIQNIFLQQSSEVPSGLPPWFSPGLTLER